MHCLNKTLLATLLAASCGLSLAQSDAATTAQPAQAPASATAPAAAPAASDTPAAPAATTQAKPADPTEDPLDAEMPPDMPDSNPKMQAAFKKGKATLKKYLAMAKNNKNPKLMVFALKVRFTDPDKKAEHMWVTPYEVKGAKFSGRLNDIPRVIKSVQHEQQVEFTTKEIVDWMFYNQDEHKMYGNYTTCARLTLGRPKDVADVKRIYGLDCTNNDM